MIGPARRTILLQFRDVMNVISKRWLTQTGTRLLRLLPAETAHHWGMRLLQNKQLRSLTTPSLHYLKAGMRMRVPGVGHLPHPIGLAAGFDKNALAPHGLARLGFSFLELGAVTPLPQPGNPKPRVFRQPEQHSLINRMGFNSDGVATVSKRLTKLRWDQEQTPLGINIGKNKTTKDDAALDDFLQVLEQVRNLVRFAVLNISSPNTPGLRSLATPEFLQNVAMRANDLLPKLWIKLDPDLNRRDFQNLVAAAGKLGFQGLILTNTHRVTWPEVGGQSGAPLAVLAASRLEWAWEVHQGSLPMIASGGIMSGLDIIERILRGASAVQIYSALVYRGPWVVADLLQELYAEMQLRGIECLEDLKGQYYETSKR